MKNNSIIINNICQWIDENPDNSSLSELAQKVSLSPSHLQKVFKKHLGISPKEYAINQKMKKAKSMLTKETSILSTIYASGHASSSRFYEKSNAHLGMKPKEYKSGAANIEIMVAVGECSLGSILVAQSLKGICAILLGDDPQKLMEDVQDMFPLAKWIAGDNAFENVVAYVVGFVDNPQEKFSLPLDIQGTVFQQKVWKILKDIPPGTLKSYTEVAQLLGMPKSVRAIANACGSNKIAVAIPCHRVIQKSGNLAGYRWGLREKKS